MKRMAPMHNPSRRGRHFINRMLQLTEMKTRVTGNQTLLELRDRENGSAAVIARVLPEAIRHISYKRALRTSRILKSATSLL
jgi:hypothetical protein